MCLVLFSTIPRTLIWNSFFWGRKALSWFWMNCLVYDQNGPLLSGSDVCLDSNDGIWDFAIFDIICLPFVLIFLETSGGKLVRRSLLTSEGGKSLDLVPLRLCKSTLAHNGEWDLFLPSINTHPLPLWMKEFTPTFCVQMVMRVQRRLNVPEMIFTNQGLVIIAVSNVMII